MKFRCRHWKRNRQAYQWQNPHGPAVFKNILTLTMASKAGIPKGTRDFDHVTVAKREYIFGIIQKHFKLYGYNPIETPSFENTETLMGKYGEEGDRLIFKIINSGDFLSGINEADYTEKKLPKILSHISEKALRYDLTVPFARYVVQHRNEITLPFKRYQIQPVWRADKPQRGRYREFYQCDADVIGSNSLNNEIELVQLMHGVFGELNIPVVIKINNRKILSGIAEVSGMPEKITEITVAIDKLDKIGKQKVMDELSANGLSADAIAKIEPLFDFAGSNDQKIALLKNYLSGSEIGLKGIEEITYVLDNSQALVPNATLELDVTLARGLNYYTGAIFEVKSAAGNLTVSICGGGRYDNLTGIFGWEGISGVGISFGADRIYDVMEELDLFKDVNTTATKALIINFGGDEEKYARKLAMDLRQAGISCELYPDSSKMDKQMKYANATKVEFVIIAGSNEIKDGKVMLKNFISGTQEAVTPAELAEKLK